MTPQRYNFLGRIELIVSDQGYVTKEKVGYLQKYPTQGSTLTKWREISAPCETRNGFPGICVNNNVYLTREHFRIYTHWHANGI